MAHPDDDIVFVPHEVSDDFAINSGYGFGYLTQNRIKNHLLYRDERAHKGMYGHALLICGSVGMIGAAVLATGAALRSGCGLVTAHIPADERFSISANYPSAMLSLDKSECFSALPKDIHKYTSIGIGSGLGVSEKSHNALKELLKWGKGVGAGMKMVIDADAINLLALDKRLMLLLPDNAILTPHDGELQRLIGTWQSNEERLIMTADFAAKHNVIIVLKGANTLICNRGVSYVSNSTGNSGMAKGGSGDVLTGFITGLLARGYTPENAAETGVYLHGLAGDKARAYFGVESMNSSDIIDFLPEAYSEISEN